MTKTCITHHYACDCREEKLKRICRAILEEHHALKEFVAGFAKADPCQCDTCKAIRELYSEDELEGSNF